MSTPTLSRNTPPMPLHRPPSRSGLLTDISAATRGGCLTSLAADEIAAELTYRRITPEALELLEVAVETNRNALAKLERILKSARPNGVPHSMASTEVSEIAHLTERAQAGWKVVQEFHGSHPGAEIDGPSFLKGNVFANESER